MSASELFEHNLWLYTLALSKPWELKEIVENRKSTQWDAVNLFTSLGTDADLLCDHRQILPALQTPASRSEK